MVLGLIAGVARVLHLRLDEVTVELTAAVVVVAVASLSYDYSSVVAFVLDCY